MNTTLRLTNDMFKLDYSDTVTFNMTCNGDVEQNKSESQ